MSNNSKIPYFRIRKKLRLAENSSFVFVILKEKRRVWWIDKKEKTVAHLGGKITPFWAFMSFILLLAAVGFGTFAAFNAQSAIAGIADPMATGILPLWLYLVIGASISIVGMLFGHLIYDGLAHGFIKDDFTDESSPSPKMWLAVVGFLGAIIYIGYQFILVKSAGNGSEILSNMPYVVVGIAIFEVLIGALILHTALAYFLLFIIMIILSIIEWRINRNAKSTYKSYSDYLTFIKALKDLYNSSPVEVECNQNIRSAIEYFTVTPFHTDNTDDQSIDTKDSNEQKASEKNIPANKEKTDIPSHALPQQHFDLISNKQLKRI